MINALFSTDFVPSAETTRFLTPAVSFTKQQLQLANTSEAKLSDEAWSARYVCCALSVTVLTGVSFSLIVALVFTSSQCIVQSMFSHTIAPLCMNLCFSCRTFAH